MPVIQQIRAKLFGPLKNALLGAALAISPGTLTKASEQALDTAVQKMADQTAQEIEKNLEEVIKNFGPEVGPNQNGRTATPNGDNFPQNPENDIIDPPKIPPANIPQGSVPPSGKPIPSSPVENESPAQAEKPYQQFDVDNPEGSRNTDPNQNGQSPNAQNRENAEGMDPEQQALAEQEAKIKQKGMIGQTVNKFRYGGQLKNLEKESKKYDKIIKNAQKGVNKCDKEIKSHNRKKLPLLWSKRWLVFAKYVLRVFNLSCGCCLFVYLVPITRAFSAVVSQSYKKVVRAIREIDQKIEESKKQKNIFETSIKWANTKKQELSLKYQQLLNADMIGGQMRRNWKR